VLRPRRIVPLSLTLLVGALWFISIDNGLPDDELAAADYSAADSPRLELTFLGEHLELDGHTVSHRQERDLRQSAARLFASAQTRATFKPFGTAPDYWASASLALLEALSATLSGNAVLVENTVLLRGVSSAGWQETLQRLRRALPESIELRVDMIIADDRIGAHELCKRAFSRYQAGAIRFEESTTELRESARLALDRAISLADACRDSMLSITGHTDSSGAETQNRALSLARANAVARYLEAGGIASGRLRTFGAGSAQPLVSNASRYGRSLNRRIEIEFRQPPL
jgi:outer membrane protein OmpA-like peptidoglycan-associated protein